MSELRKLPRVDLVSQAEELAHFPAKTRVQAVRRALDMLRNRAKGGNLQEAVALAVEEANRSMAASLRPVINATGVILHTGAGRARLAKEAVEQVAAVAASHSSLELSLDTGRRGDRQAHVSHLLKELTGAEDAFVVNNCAAALFLTLAALARRKEVILSRGEMVEIGGSFRLPDIVRQSGCKLIEVGTTNKTKLEDYEQAITARTAAILRCHPSNFRVIGFAERVALMDLSKFAHSNDVILIDDVGSGCLIDTEKLGLPKEPTLQESIASGADVVTASADKLMGGPQAGIILGKAEVVKRIRKHPLARVVRIDKLSLAALEATLRLYATGLEREIPTLHYLMKSMAEIEQAARKLQQAYEGIAVVQDGITEVGGGSLPGTGLPTFRVGLKAPKVDLLAKKLRSLNPPILTRIEDNLVWIDPRTLEEEEVTLMEAALRVLP